MPNPQRHAYQHQAQRTPFKIPHLQFTPIHTIRTHTKVHIYTHTTRARRTLTAQTYTQTHIQTHALTHTSTHKHPHDTNYIIYTNTHIHNIYIYEYAHIHYSYTRACTCAYIHILTYNYILKLKANSKQKTYTQYTVYNSLTLSLNQS